MANPKEGNKAVAKVEDKANAVVVAEDYGQYAGAGFEGHTKEDYAVPFINVLQSNSPQVDEIKEAKAGMFINTVTNDLIPGEEGVCLIPCHTSHIYVEWKPRDSGGGFVGLHQLDSDIVKQCRATQDFGKFKLANGNDLIETFYVYAVIAYDDGRTEQAVLAFSSTKIKAYKNWMSKARTVQVILPDGKRQNPPLFAHKYRMKSFKDRNSKGEFYNVDINFDSDDNKAPGARLSPKDELFQTAVGFGSMVKEGAVKASYETQGKTGGAETGQDAEIPFE
jgi:hypothetical protein